MRGVAEEATEIDARRHISGARAPVLLAALALLAAVAAGCAPKRVFGPYPDQPAPPGRQTPAPPDGPDEAAAAGALGAAQDEEAARGAAAAQRALALVGVAYRPGGDSPTGGFDCSGFVRYVYLQAGIALPRQSADQARVGRPVSPAGLSPGDLVFFRKGGRPISHAGIWVGDGRFAHAPKAGDRVRVERLSDEPWSTRYAGARRP